MTYKNTYKTTPLATFADTVVEEKVIVNEKRNTKKNLTTVQKWVAVGAAMAILVPMLIFAIGLFDVEEIANLFAGGLFSINTMLTVVGGAVSGALLTYAAYRVKHRDYELTSATNPAWAFKYAKYTVLVYFIVSFLNSVFDKSVAYLGDVFNASIPGMLNSVMYYGDAVLVLTVLGVLTPVAYELVVGNIIQRKVAKNTNKAIGSLAHAVLTFVAFAMLGGNVVAGVVISIIAAMSYTNYKHGTYPASVLVASNIITIAFNTSLGESVPLYIVVYIVLTVLQKVIHYFVCKLQED